MTETNEKKETRPWTYPQTKLLISTRLKYEEEFSSGKRKKSSLWHKVLEEMRGIDIEFPFTVEEIHRKFNNLLITYKRIKQRNSESGRDATKWEHYETFHSVYGTKHFIVPPKSHQISTLGTESEDNTSEDEEHVVTKKSRSRTSQRNINNEILEFFKNEAVEEERRHQEQLKIEAQRIEVLKGIREVLERMFTQE